MNETGIFSVGQTPFNQDESINYDLLRGFVDFAVQAGVSGVCTPMYGSEFYKLSEQEREKVLLAVIEQADGRIPVIAQCNHVSPQVVSEIAKKAKDMGADLIGTAMPRQFPSTRSDLFNYAKSVCSAVNLPVVIQDWNYGNETIDATFIKTLYNECGNLRYVKFEDRAIGDKVASIREATGGNVKVLTGWWGSYALELIPAGVAGIMPAIPLADYFKLLWDAAVSGDMKKAYSMFTRLAAYNLFGLKNYEVFHYIEKKLLVRRGLLELPVVRPVTIELDSYELRYLEVILDDVCGAIEEFGLSVRVG